MTYRLTYTSTRPDTTKDWYFFAEDVTLVLKLMVHILGIEMTRGRMLL